MAIPTEPVFSLDGHPVFDLPLRGDLAVVFCHFNPAGFERPRRNLAAFLDHLYLAGIPAFGAELALPPRPHFALYGTNRRVVQVRGESLLFHKEPLWNLAAQSVPEQFTKLLFLDADVILCPRPPEDSLQAVFRAVSQALDHQPLVQPFSRAVWLDAEGAEIRCRPGSAYAHAHGRPDFADVRRCHPGFGFGLRRDFFRAIGGFTPCAILGGGDLAMLLAAAGEMDLHPDDVESSPHPYIARNPLSIISPQLAWARTVHQLTGGRIGHVRADAVHLWHGSGEHRAYAERYALVRRHDARDLTLSPAGVLEWTPAARSLKADMVAAVAAYFPSRREDG